VNPPLVLPHLVRVAAPTSAGQMAPPLPRPIRLRAERRIGEIMAEQAKAVGKAKGRAGS
jgi:hypothetical protein